MNLVYSGKSRASALAIEEASNGSIQAYRSSGKALINWGRRTANTQLNPDISNSVNKRVMRELFRNAGVPMPQLRNTMHSRMRAFANHETIVGRPDHHLKGRGFWLCKDFNDVRKALRGTRRKAAATHFMSYIEAAQAPREYRVQIFLGKSIRVSEKAHTAFHEYTTIKPTHNIKHVRRAAKQAINAVGLDFGAVDILANDEECWVLEVNASPGLGGSMPALYARKFQEWYESNA